MTRSDPASLRVVDLRSELKKLGLDFKGKKAELVARLEAAFKASTAEPTDKPGAQASAQVAEPADVAGTEANSPAKNSKGKRSRQGQADKSKGGCKGPSGAKVGASVAVSPDAAAKTTAEGATKAVGGGQSRTAGDRDEAAARTAPAEAPNHTRSAVEVVANDAEAGGAPAPKRKASSLEIKSLAQILQERETNKATAAAAPPKTHDASAAIEPAQDRAPITERLTKRRKVDAKGAVGFAAALTHIGRATQAQAPARKDGAAVSESAAPPPTTGVAGREKKDDLDQYFLNRRLQEAGLPVVPMLFHESKRASKPASKHSSGHAKRAADWTNVQVNIAKGELCLLEEQGVFLTPDTGCEILLRCDAGEIGQVSNWDIRERIEKSVRPHAIKLFKPKPREASASEAVFVVEFEGASFGHVRSKLHGKDTKFKGNSSRMQLLCRELNTKANSPQWQQAFPYHFDDCMPGDRPDTLVVSHVPASWFKVKGEPTMSAALVRQAFASFGNIRKVHIGGDVADGIGLNSVVYVQFSDVAGCLQALHSIGGRKLIRRNALSGRETSARVTAKIDTGAYLSEKNIRGRQYVVEQQRVAKLAAADKLQRQEEAEARQQQAAAEAALAAQKKLEADAEEEAREEAKQREERARKKEAKRQLKREAEAVAHEAAKEEERRFRELEAARRKRKQARLAKAQAQIDSLENEPEPDSAGESTTAPVAHSHNEPSQHHKELEPVNKEGLDLTGDEVYAARMRMSRGGNTRRSGGGGGGKETADTESNPPAAAISLGDAAISLHDDDDLDFEAAGDSPLRTADAGSAEKNLRERLLAKRKRDNETESPKGSKGSADEMRQRLLARLAKKKTSEASQAASNSIFDRLGGVGER